MRAMIRVRASPASTAVAISSGCGDVGGSGVGLLGVERLLDVLVEAVCVWEGGVCVCVCVCVPVDQLEVHQEKTIVILVSC